MGRGIGMTAIETGGSGVRQCREWKEHIQHHPVFFDCRCWGLDYLHSIFLCLSQVRSNTKNEVRSCGLSCRREREREIDSYSKLMLREIADRGPQERCNFSLESNRR